MRSHEFLNEDIDPDDVIEMDSSEVAPWVERAFHSVYPGVELYFEDEDYIYASTNEDPMAATAWGVEDKVSDDYYFAFGAGVANGGFYVSIGNATAGEYKGVTAKIIKSVFDGLTQKFGKPRDLTITVLQDSSGGVWQRIAQQLGANYENID